MYEGSSFRPIDRDKRGRLKVKHAVSRQPVLKKPHWIKAKAPISKKVLELKHLLRQHQLHSVCEEASCPNLGECFERGTATFMIMGDICTRRCPFCDVAHGRPKPLDSNEPEHLAKAIAQMKLKYVVITSVDRDDLPDRGASHFVSCIDAIRTHAPDIKIEILVPDFRNRITKAVDILTKSPPDVFNHNIETVPRLYKTARPGAVYQDSLRLLAHFKQCCPDVPTKSGLMLGLGETLSEIETVLRDLRANHCDMATIGQYLQPSQYHLEVARFVSPAEFNALESFGMSLGFRHVASGPMVRSSYHADFQAQEMDTVC